VIYLYIIPAGTKLGVLLNFLLIKTVFDIFDSCYQFWRARKHRVAIIKFEGLLCPSFEKGADFESTINILL